ncbi:MAG: flagellin [Parvularculaceae bacterium]
MIRISDLAFQQILLSGFQRAQGAAQERQIQVSSGKVSQTYGGLGASALQLLSMEGALSRANAFESAAKSALSRLQVQEAGLTTIADAVGAARADFVRTLATGSAELLLPGLEVHAQRMLSALNASIGGVFVFGGDKGDEAPVAASTLADLGAAGSIDALFREGDARVRLAVEEGVAVDGGPLASEVGRDLLIELQELANAEATLGPFDGDLTAAQRDFLVEKVARFDEIAAALNQTLGLNGVSQAQTEEAIARNVQRRDLAEVVAADIEDVDIAEAIVRLNQDQLAVQAAARALADATELSLLNFI